MGSTEPLWLRDSDDDVSQKIDAAQQARGGNRSDAIRSLIRDAPAPNEYASGCKRHLQAIHAIEIELTPFEARAVGNRLWYVAQEKLPNPLANETKWLARRLHQKAGEAEQPTDTLQVRLSEFEARVIGNRMQMVEALYDGPSQYGDEATKMRQRFRQFITSRNEEIPETVESVADD